MKNRRRANCVLLIASTISLAVPVSAAADFSVGVTTHADEFGEGGDCSLREAVQVVNGSGAPFGGCLAQDDGPNLTGDFVDLPAGPDPYRLTRVGIDDTNAAGDLDIHKPLHIRGNQFALASGGSGFEGLFQAATIEQTTTDRVLDFFQPDGFTRLEALNVTGGHSDLGAGIRINGTAIETEAVSIYGNHADQGADAAGGAIWGGHNVFLHETTISGNTANGPGGGIFMSGTWGATLVQVTLANNTARADGAGGAGGGGVVGATNADQIVTANSIVAENSDLGPVPAPNCSPGIKSMGVLFPGTPGYNLIGDLTGCAFAAGANDTAPVAEVGIAPLADAGGFFQMHALEPGSPAIDAANPQVTSAAAPNWCGRFDERGIYKDTFQTEPCDIGAYEVVRCEQVLVNEIGTPAFVVQGGDESDGFIGTPGNDSLNGEGGNDAFCADSGDDAITAGLGSDVIRSEVGNDTIDAGDGNDVVEAGAGDDGIAASTGDDQINGDIGNDTIDAGDGNDSVLGGDGDDTVAAGIGDDTVAAGIGDDTVFASTGNDQISGDEGVDVLDGGEGDDRASGGDGDDRAIGGSGNDRVGGSDGNDKLSGGDGNDKLKGGDGRDKLKGGDGKDRLVGGKGKDKLVGGGGNDVCIGDESDVFRSCEEVKVKKK